MKAMQTATRQRTQRAQLDIISTFEVVEVTDEQEMVADAFWDTGQ